MPQFGAMHRISQGSPQRNNRTLYCVSLIGLFQARAQKSWVVTRGLRTREASIGNLIPREGEKEMERANSDSES